MLFHSMKQSLNISLRLFANANVAHLYFKPLGKLNTTFTYFYNSNHVSDMVALKLPEREFKVLLNFERERIKHAMFTE